MENGGGGGGGWGKETLLVSKYNSSHPMEKVSESLACGELFLVWFQKTVQGCCVAAPQLRMQRHTPTYWRTECIGHQSSEASEGRRAPPMAWRVGGITGT